ncbi:MAG: DUF4349 domain-containing protein [Pirellulales bacterium]
MLGTKKFFGAASLVAVLSFVGCGVEFAHKSAQEAASESEIGAPAATAAPADSYYLGAQVVPTRFSKDATGVGTGEPIVSTSPGADRKIIYNGQIDLVVEDFSGLPERVVELVKKYGAYVASSTLHGVSGSNRRATWTIRVPVDRYEEFVNTAKSLGEVKSVGTTSSDVSEEYYDVEARIRNKTKEEERLLKLLEERPGKLEDVIAIERELSRVREELERMQGRMRVLADLTSLTTVTLSIEEIKDYQPPQAPTLATRVRRSFEGSLAAIQAVGEALLIAAVTLAPWLPIAGVALVPGYLAVRRTRRRHRRGEKISTD